MKTELEEKLLTHYPEIFYYIRESKRQGENLIEIEDGWFWLIDQLCAELKRLEECGHPCVRILRLNEKFGILRISVSEYSFSELEHEFIIWTEHLSTSICRNCGTTQNVRLRDLRKKITFMVLCDQCFELEKSSQ